MKYPSHEQHWDEWGMKMAYSKSIGNFERYWLKFLKIHKKWWYIMKRMEPCKKCKLKESCPDMYACVEWVEWAMTEE